MIRIVTLIYVSLFLVSLIATASPPNDQAVRYWRCEKLHQLHEMQTTSTNVVAECLGEKIIVSRAAMQDNRNKTRGALSAFLTLLQQVKASDSVKNPFVQAMVQQATNQLQQLQGERLTISKYFTWYRENGIYAYWDDRVERLVVDQEAKAAKTETFKYRAKHPWP